MGRQAGVVGGAGLIAGADADVNDLLPGGLPSLGSDARGMVGLQLMHR